MKPSLSHPLLRGGLLALVLAARPAFAESAAPSAGPDAASETAAEPPTADEASAADPGEGRSALAPEDADPLPASGRAAPAPTEEPATERRMAARRRQGPSLPAAAAGADVPELPSLEVRGRRHAPGQAQDATALKLGLSLRETPRSLTVMDAARLKEQNFTTAAQTFNYTPGVFANSYGQGGYHFYSRGQRMAAVDNRVDGFAGIAAGGDYSPSLFGIERTVMLRGPASLLYGSTGAPGGMINLVTKKPRAARSTELNLSMGPYGGSSVGFNDGSSYGAELDATGPLSDDGRVLYRAQGRFENERHFTADVMDRNRYLNLALTYNLDAEGRYQLTPMFQTTRHWRPAGRASVISPMSSVANRGGSSAIDFDGLSSLDVNLSSGGRLDETFMAGGDFRAKPSDALQVNAAYRYFTYDTDVNQWAPTGQASRDAAGEWVVSRAQTRSLNERFNHGFDLNAAYDHKPAAGAWKNLSQVGFNARITGTDRSASFTGPAQSPINIRTGAAPALVDSNAALRENFNNTSYQWNVYAQNQTSLLDGMFVATLGLGYMQEHLDRDYGRTAAAKPANLGDVLATRHGRPTPNAALLYNVNRSLGFYVSYATSYTLVGGDVEDRNGETGNFDPVQGENYEVGAKYDLPALAASLSTALFRAETRNALVTTTGDDRNVNGRNYAYQVDGEGRQSVGVELSGEVEPLRNWRLSAGGAWLDVTNRNSRVAVADGARGDKVPEWSMNAFTRYDIGAGSFQGLGASLGLVYQGDRLAALRSEADPEPLVMPWFARVDAGLFYRVHNRLDFALNVENLANDERIVYSASNTGIIELGSPRRATFRTTYRM